MPFITTNNGRPFNVRYETTEEAAPIALGPSIDVIDGPGGNSLLDVCAPTPIIMAAVALIMEQLAALPATA